MPYAHYRNSWRHDKPVASRHLPLYSVLPPRTLSPANAGYCGISRHAHYRAGWRHGKPRYFPLFTVILRSAATHSAARECGVLRHQPPRTLSHQLAARFRLTCPTSPTSPTAAIYHIARVCGERRHEPPPHYRWQAILRGKVAFCKADKRGSIPLYVTERFAAARREISRKIACLKYGIRR